MMKGSDKLNERSCEHELKKLFTAKLNFDAAVAVCLFSGSPSFSTLPGTSGKESSSIQ